MVSAAGRRCQHRRIETSDNVSSGRDVGSGGQAEVGDAGVPEDVLADLASDGAGEVVDDEDVGRDLEVGDLAAAEGAEVVGGE
jgi:hypothetical protein